MAPRASTLLTANGTYLITAATLHRKPLFDSGAKLSLFRDKTFELAANYSLSLQAWAFFPNHYHIVISFHGARITHGNFIRHLHRELALHLNRIDNSPGKGVMYQFWDTDLTFEKSWLCPTEVRPSQPGAPRTRRRRTRL